MLIFIKGLKFFLEVMDTRGTTQFVSAHSSKVNVHMAWGLYISAHVMNNLHICEGNFGV